MREKEREGGTITAICVFMPIVYIDKSMIESMQFICSRCKNVSQTKVVHSIACINIVDDETE